MKTFRISTIVLLLFFLTPALTLAFGDSIRYKGKLIRNGDTKAAVLKLLGPPDAKSIVKSKYYPGQTLKRYYVSGNLEEWIYTKINYT